MNGANEFKERNKGRIKIVLVSAISMLAIVLLVGSLI